MSKVMRKATKKFKREYREDMNFLVAHMEVCFLMAHREFSLGCQLILLQTTNVINRHVESMHDYVRSSY
jgi:hypothetical protein